MVISVSPPSRFSKAKAARIIRHELLHAEGLEHEDMTEREKWSSGKEPRWSKGKRVRYRGKAKSVRRRLK
jgi:hypothetical protein